MQNIAIQHAFIKSDHSKKKTDFQQKLQNPRQNKKNPDQAKKTAVATLCCIDSKHICCFRFINYHY